MFFVLIHFMPTRLVYEHNALELQAPTHSSPPLGFFWPGIKYCELVDQFKDTFINFTETIWAKFPNLFAPFGP